MISLTQGDLTVVVRTHWAHTSLSPLHRTTAVGAGNAAAQGDPAGTVHEQIQVASVSLSADFISEEDFTWQDIQQQLPGQIPQPRRERRRENFWLLLRDFFFVNHISVTLEVRPVCRETGWDRYSFPSPCAWAPLSRSTWKVSGKVTGCHYRCQNILHDSTLQRGSTKNWSIAMGASLHIESDQVNRLFKGGVEPTWIAEQNVMCVYGERVLFAE